MEITHEMRFAVLMDELSIADEDGNTDYSKHLNYRLDYLTIEEDIWSEDFLPALSDI